MKRLALVLLALAVAGCVDVTYRWRMDCRGDSVNADFQDTAMVKCSTVDSLAVR